MMEKARTVSRTQDGLMLAREKMTVTLEREYLPMAFTKLFHNTELLEDLSPWACKILIHIALHIKYQQELIRLTPLLVGMDKRKFSTTVVELAGRHILVKQKKEWYWVNVTLLIVGNLSKH